MEANPEFDNISEAERLGMSTIYGATVGTLEHIGFRNVIKSKGLLNQVILNTLGKTPKGATVKTFQQILAQDVKSGLARGALTLTAAGLAEFETGFLQQGADIGIKSVYNSMKDKEMFNDVPNDFLTITGQMLQAGFEEALGGFMFGSIPATQAAPANRS